MLVLAAALTLGINLELDLGALLQRRKPVAQPKVTCGIHTIGYRFRGHPGQQFRYGRRTFTIPSEGWIELIAEPHAKSFTIDNRTLPLGDDAMDAFSIQTVDLPVSPRDERTDS